MGEHYGGWTSECPCGCSERALWQKNGHLRVRIRRGAMAETRGHAKARHTSNRDAHAKAGAVIVDKI